MKQIIFTVDPNEYKKEIVTDIVEQLSNSFGSKTNNPQRLLSRKETAAYLKIALSTLWKLTKSNQIKALYIGNRVFYRIEDIENALIKL